MPFGNLTSLTSAFWNDVVLSKYPVRLANFEWDKKKKDMLQGPR